MHAISMEETTRAEVKIIRCCNLSIPGTLAEASPDEVQMIGSQMCLHVADALQAM